jgi:hypothetical protein
VAGAPCPHRWALRRREQGEVRPDDAGSASGAGHVGVR